MRIYIDTLKKIIKNHLNLPLSTHNNIIYNRIFFYITSFLITNSMHIALQLIYYSPGQQSWSS